MEVLEKLDKAVARAGRARLKVIRGKKIKTPVGQIKVSSPLERSSVIRSLYFK